MDVWTDYPVTYFGDKPGKDAPMRKAEVLSYDGDKYCKVRVRSDKCDRVVADLEIKSGYLYENELKRPVSREFLNFMGPEPWVEGHPVDENAKDAEEEKAHWGAMRDHARFFLRGQAIGDEICAPVVLVFEESPPADVMLEDWQDIADQEAQRLFDLLRNTMPQGILDRLGALIMRDRASDFIISKTDLDRRDGRG